MPAARGCSIPRSAAEEIRRNAERGFKAVTFPEAPHAARPAVAAHGLLGPVHARRARRPARSSACTSARPARRRRRPTTRRPTPSACCSSATRCSPRSTGCTRRSRCGSPTSRSASPRAASAGCRRCSTASTTCCRYHEMYGTWSGIELTPAEVLQRNFWFCAIEDPSAFAHARPHRRRPHPARVGLPAPRLHVARHPGDPRSARSAGSRPTTSSRHVAQRLAPVRHPVPAAVQRDPDAF